MPAGRPTDYRPCFAAQIIEYFLSHEPFREQRVPWGTGKEKIQLVPNKFPTITRFAANIGVCQETL